MCSRGALPDCGLWLGQLAEARRLNAEMVKKALALEGTCTGEHGVGVGKIKYLEGKHSLRQQQNLREPILKILKVGASAVISMG